MLLEAQTVRPEDLSLDMASMHINRRDVVKQQMQQTRGALMQAIEEKKQRPKTNGMVLIERTINQDLLKEAEEMLGYEWLS